MVKVYGEKVKIQIGNLPSLKQRRTYMSVVADIHISNFYLFADEMRRNNNFGLNEEYKAKINSLVTEITSEFFAHCREAK